MRRHSARQSNPILRRLAAPSFMPTNEAHLRVWNSVARHHKDFPQLVAAAVDSGHEDINRVVMLLEAVLTSDTALHMDKVMPILDKMISGLEPSAGDYVVSRFEFLGSYIRKVGADTDQGRTALAKLECLVDIDVFEKNGGDFFNRANHIAMLGRRGIEPYDQAMVAIWKRLMNKGLSRCVDSHGSRRPYLECNNRFIEREEILHHVKKYYEYNNAIGKAAREIIDEHMNIAAPDIREGDRAVVGSKLRSGQPGGV